VESPNASASFGSASSKTKRILLRNERAEFGASTFSASLAGVFFAPNRDYAFEGLSFFGAANWKYLDALFFALQKVGGAGGCGGGGGGGFLALKPERVVATPFEAVYSYSYSERPEQERCGSVDVSYSLESGRLLMRLENKASTARRASSIRSAHSARSTRFVLKPLVDVRFMYADSAPFEHEISFSENNKVFCASRAGRKLFVESADFESASLQAKPQRWVYGLGCGERVSPNEFKAEERAVLDAGEIFLKPTTKSVVEIRCGEARATKKRVERIERLGAGVSGSAAVTAAARRASALRVLDLFAGELAAAEARWGREAGSALAARLLSLHEFGLRCHHPSFSGPDAGCFWFRDLWFRDALEGIRVNKAVYVRTRPEWLQRFFDGARHFSLNGLVPTRFSEESGAPVYDSVDASLSFYPLALDFFEERRDVPRFAKVLRSAEKFFESLQAGRFAKFAEVDESDDSLLKTLASRSWTDSVSNGIPNRLPRNWRSAGNAARKFFLIEINAAWIRFLSRTGLLPAGADSLERVARGFKRKFWAEPRFPTHVAGDSRAVGFERSNEKSSFPLEAAALLPELFSDSEAALLLSKAEPLFVRRNGGLFGALLRDGAGVGAEPFLGDAQYHGGVVWPREAPYLASLLLRVGRFREAEEMLLNALDHQQGESTLFYSNEVFSVDDAGNGKSEVVPVKNPAQYWSNWVQPFFDFLSVAPPSRARLSNASAELVLSPVVRVTC